MTGATARISSSTRFMGRDIDMAYTDTWEEWLAKLDNSQLGKQSPLTPIFQMLDRPITNPATYEAKGEEL
jgi:hypothetical protein